MCLSTSAAAATANYPSGCTFWPRCSCLSIFSYKVPTQLLNRIPVDQLCVRVRTYWWCSGKSSREAMCLGGVSGRGADAQWKQTGSIARGSLPWSALECRLLSAESHLICTHLVYLCVYVYRLILFQVWVNYLRFVFEEGFMQLPDDSLQM